MKKVAILLAVGFEEIEAVTPIDFLRRAGIEVIVCGINEESVTGSNGIVLKSDCGFDDLPTDLDGICCYLCGPGNCVECSRCT